MKRYFSGHAKKILGYNLLVCLCLLLPSMGEGAKKDPKNPETLSGVLVDEKAKLGTKAEAYYHFSLGRMMEENGESLKAQEEYKRAVQMDPQSSNLRLELANFQLRRRNLRAAVQEAETAVQLETANVEAHRLLASIYLMIVKNEDPNRSTISGDYLKKAIQEYEAIHKLDPADGESLLNLSGLYREDGDTEKAVATLNKYLELVPASDAGLSYLSQIYAEQGKFKEAVAALKKALEATPDSPTILAQLAFTYEQAKDFKQSIEYYRQAIAADEDSLNLRKGLAQALLDDDREEEAEKEYLRVIEADPDEGVAFLRLGQISRGRGENEKALEYFNKANAILVGSYEVAFNIASLYEDSGKFDKALDGFKQLIKLTEKSSGTYTTPEKQNRTVFLYHGGVCAQQLEKYPEAIDYFAQIKNLNAEGDIRADLNIIDTYRLAKQIDKALEASANAIKLFPQEKDFKIQRAELLAESGKATEAIQELQRLLTGGDEDARIYSAMVQVYQKDKKFKEAEKILLSGEKSFKNRETYFFMLGAIYERQKDFEKAEATFKKILEINPKNAAAMNYMGYMWADLNVRLTESLELLTKAVNQDPNNGAYLDSLGWVYFRLNQLEQSELYLKKAAERVRKDPTIHEHLGDLYALKGQLDEARKSYELSVMNNQDEEEIRKVQKKLDDLKVRMALVEQKKKNQ